MQLATPSTHAATRQMGAGVGAKPQHWGDILDVQADGFWLEVHAENHMVLGGPRLAVLEAIHAKHGLSVHGVGLSLAGPAPLDKAHLSRFSSLIQRTQPDLVSEHLAWCVDASGYFPDLLPAARTPALLNHVVSRVQQVQDAIGRPIAIENPSHYTAQLMHTLAEAEFFNALATRSGCTLLLDLNNVVLSSHNLHTGTHHWQSASNWVFELNASLVSEIHLAGVSIDEQATNACGEPLWIDSHSSAVSPPVWDLYRRFIEHAGSKPTLIEWDNDVPAFDTLWQLRDQAQQVLNQQQVRI